MNILRVGTDGRSPMLYTKVWFKMTNFNNVLKLNDDDTVTYLEVDPKTGEETTKELTDVPDELMDLLRLGATVTLSQYHAYRSERVDREYMRGNTQTSPVTAQNKLADDSRDVNKAVVYQNEETLG